MRKLKHDRRGSVAFATVIAMVPLIGVIALGAEAGSWYVTKQHAQNAADAAALSGGLALACTISGSNCDLGHDYSFRGKEFAAQNNFCNSGDTSYPGSTCAVSLPSGTSLSVQIDRGSYDSATKAWTTTASGTSVRASVSQTQKAYLSALLGLKTLNIGAAAIAQVLNPYKVCTLALGRFPASGGSLKLSGNLTSTGTGCELMSNDTVQFASSPSFTGTGWAVGATSGCSGPNCALSGIPYNYALPPATNPLSALDSASFNSITGSDNKFEKSMACPSGVPSGTKNCWSIAPNPTGPAYAGLSVSTGDYVDFQPTSANQTFIFYNATIKMTGGAVGCSTCTSWTAAVSPGRGVSIVLLGDSSLSINGGTVALSAPKTNTNYSALNGILIDDQAPNKQKNAVTINGGGNVALGGAVYFPNVDVTWSGTVQNTNTSCSEVIANTLTMSGGAYMNSDTCLPTTVPFTQIVRLVY